MFRLAVYAAALLLHGPGLSALLLNPAPGGAPADAEPGVVGGAADPVKVMVFGDSWGAMGPSSLMLDDMFMRHGVSAIVKNMAISGTRSCQWAKVPDSINQAIEKSFGIGSTVDYIWMSIGGNDLLTPDYLDCGQEAKDFDEARKCAHRVGKHVQACQETLLDNLWSVPRHANVQVVQCTYEFQCHEGNCVPQMRFPFCASNATCANVLGMDYQDALLFHTTAKYAKYPQRYTGININGVLQEVAGRPGAKIGKPVITEGSPCEMMFACVHPHYGSKAVVAIGEAFWNMFFSSRVRGHSEPRRHGFLFDVLRQQPKQRLPGSKHGDADANDVDITIADTYCNYNWIPSFDDDARPPCNRTSFP